MGRERPPTVAQLAAMRRVRDERIACVCFRSHQHHATYVTTSFRNAYAPIDDRGSIVGPEIRFDVMVRLEARGWVQTGLPGDPIVTLTEAGRALVG